MLSIASCRKGNADPRIEIEISHVLKSFLFSRGVELVIEDAWFLKRFESHSHGLFIIAHTHSSNLQIPFSPRVVGLRFLFLFWVENNSLVPWNVKDTISWKQGDWFGDIGIDAEYVFELENLLRYDGGYSSGFHLQLQN